MDNYCTVNIKGREVGLKFGLPSVRQITRKSIENDLSDGKGSYNEIGYANILYAGYINNCMVKEIKPDLLLEHFVDHVEDKATTNDFSELIAALRVFQESKTVKSLAAIGEALKKKTQSPQRQTKRKRK